MSGSGLSRARLDRMHDVMAGYVEHGEIPGLVTAVSRHGEIPGLVTAVSRHGEIPGLVTAVSRHGEVHVDAIGMQSAGSSEAMRRDTIFRISSMSKPISAPATMMLVEECTLRLDEPVDRLLPELAGRKVLKRLDGSLDDTVPANRPITVRDLLSFGLAGESVGIDGASVFHHAPY